MAEGLVCVGGPSAGLRVVGLPRERSWVELADPAELPSLSSINPAQERLVVEPMPAHTRTMYTRRFYRSKTQLAEYLAPATMSDVEAFCTLLDEYKRVRHVVVG